MTLVERARAALSELPGWLKTLPWPSVVGYPAFFLLALFASFWLTFPSEQLATRVELEAKNRLGMRLSVGSARPAGLTGVTLRDVSWHLGDEDAAPPAAVAAVAPAAGAPPAEGEAATEGEAPPAPAAQDHVSIDSATVKLGLIAALRGRQDVHFDVEAFGGEIEGRMESGSEARVIEAKLRDVDLARSPLPGLGLKMQGKLQEVTVELTTEGGDLQKTTGQIAMRGEGLVLEGGEVQHFELPKVDMGKLDATIEVGGGKADLTRFEIQGPDLEGKIEGFVRLAPRLSSSTLSGKIKLKPSDDWWNRNQMIKDMANFGLPAQKDGYRVINLFGQIAKPSFRPQR